MEKHLLVGNGINIQFGGFDNYSNSAIIKRVIKNIKAGKYNELTENSLTPEEQLGLPVIANPRFMLDMKQASRSMEKLLSLQVKAYFCYHGGVYSSAD